ncbi:unnamed protein product, partial [Candidula unifasciata]
KLYIPSARQLRRYKSKFSSPVFVHFKETLDGTHTVRAFKAQARFIRKMKKSVEDRVRFDFMELALRTWLGMKVFTLSQFVSLAAGLIVVWDDSFSPSQAGMLLSFSSWAPWEIAEKTPADAWPQDGEIVFEDYKTRYRDGLDLVLRGVTCSIGGGEK